MADGDKAPKSATGTPDTLEQARERRRQLRLMEQDHGPEWVKQNKARLDAEWVYAKDLGLV